MDAFYERDGDRYVASELTRGPWDESSQHAGPPAALLGREIERLEDADDFEVGRLTFEILRAAPISTFTAEAAIVRPGKRVQLVEAALSDGDGVVTRARGWRIRRARVDLPEDATAPADEPPEGPEKGVEREFFPTGQATGYHTAMEYRFLRGAYTEPGPAIAWMRMRTQLVAGEEPSPLQRVLVVADSGNGVSAPLDWRRFLFINVDLTVQLERLPAGEWVCIDAVTLPQRTGIGSTDALLLDERGRFGRALQTLLVGAR